MSGLIEDYAVIGDSETAALVSRSGSIDWFCIPRFDSPACFAALLGDEKEHGRWVVAPEEPVTSTARRYRDDTLILETEFTTDAGVVAVTDFMPQRAEYPTIVRIVEGRAGEVRVGSTLSIRFDYGSIVPWVQRLDDQGLHAIGGADALVLRSPVPFRGKGMQSEASFVVREGDQVAFALTTHPSCHAPPQPVDARKALEDTEQFWTEWAGRCTYEGPYREAVVRSLITLKALTHAPTGGLVAAATTSLPETVGGPRNWDYRYCWLRDATFTLTALVGAGYPEEAHAWVEWLRRAVAGSPDKMQIMYGVGGERRLTEYEVPELPGYEGSAPVRVGNAASGQFQLDVYGEVMDLFLAAHREPDVGLPYDARTIGRFLVDHVAKVWDQPDDGIWEVRGGRRHFTHSKVMAWVAVDRGVKLAEALDLDVPLREWRDLRDEIHRDVCEKGFDPSVGAFTQAYGSTNLDASALMFALVRFLPASDPRIRGTVDAIIDQLATDGFVLRYRTDQTDDGLTGREGSFLLTSFWLVDNLALLGRRDEAVALYEKLLDLRNDVGLLSEEYDTADSRMLGNFPQAFSHVGTINCALNLAREGTPEPRRG